ncbi:MAG TPA: YibE/F family protein [Egibacteraceae bacterium]|nr:YibE/F family protein [Egibacteraceae bacterium]
MTYRVLLAIVGVIAVTAVGGMTLLRPVAPPAPPDEQAVQSTDLVNATLLEVTTLAEDEELGLLPGATVVEITARLEDSGETVTFETADETGGTYAAGQRVRLAAIAQEGQETAYFVSDFRRGGPMAVLTVLFVAAVLGFARLQGLRALLGLAITFAVIIWFIVPAILGGRSPVAVAVVGALGIMIVTLYLSHGVGRKTTAAVVGTAAALLATAALAALFVDLARITGLASEEARQANFQVGGLSLQGLLLAGIIIGGLGVLDDVTLSQASTVFELRRANPRLGFNGLMRGALTVGRDHIAATVNTLFLAYAGASLPLLILFTSSVDSATTIVTAEVVAVEVVRTLVGSIGLIAAVPLTTALAAALASAEPDAVSRETIEGAHGQLHSAPPAAAAAPAPGHSAPAQPPAAPAADPGAPASPDIAAGTASPDERGELGMDPDSPPVLGPEADEDELWIQRLRQAYRLPSKTPPPHEGQGR